MAEDPEDNELKKVLIEVLEGDPFEGPQELLITFYPTEYSLDKSLTYGEQNLPGLTSPLTQFGTGDAATLSMELLFDTYEDGLDVRKEYTDKVDALMEVDEDLHTPPILRVVWGSLTKYKWILESANKRFTLFHADGTPARARVDVTFKQYYPPNEQLRDTPRSSADRTKVWRVTEGETLWSIASKEYGDPGQWRTIATANDITDPRTLEAGRELVIPRLKA
jgi:hypothetical protein